MDTRFAAALAAAFAIPVCLAADAPRPLCALDIAQLRGVGEVAMAPDASRVAYTLSVPRRPGKDDNGGAWTELHVVGSDGKGERGYVTGKVSVSSIRFAPDGKAIYYAAKRGDDKIAQVWAIPVDGGESQRITELDTDAGAFDVAPDGASLAMVVTEAVPAATKKLREKGFNQQVVEEDWQPRRLLIVPLPAGPFGKAGPARTLDGLPGQPFHVAFSPDGTKLAVDIAATPLIDDEYMFRRIVVVDVATGAATAQIGNQGKLGRFDWSTDGKTILLISGNDIHDPSAGRLMAAPATGGTPRDLLPRLEGTVESFVPLANGEVLYLAAVRVGSEIGRVHADGTGPAVEMTGTEPVFASVAASRDGRRLALAGDTPAYPREAFAWMRATAIPPQRLTTSNAWLAERRLAPQEIVRFTARDGLTIDGLLMRPLGVAAGTRAPLVIVAHGGPESHYGNGWLTRYAEPGQVLAGLGYAVFYPNYRGSTGRGVAFGTASQGDAGGKEFDDVIDAVDYLVAQGIADGKRVGITGGSYGGYFTALGATRYSDRFAAAVMFVGIADPLFKARTTEIPREDELVHTLTTPDKAPERYLAGTPLHYLAQAKTPILILGGKDDTRVDPSQSRALFRALKSKGDVPVRYVAYPGEGHGNRNAAARYDYSLRSVEWFEHFLKQRKPGLPPVTPEYALD